jgi:predicted aspartyl protease
VRFAFDETFDPPAPVLPVHVEGVTSDSLGVLVHAIVDAGADCSVIPARVARVLKLPIVDHVFVKGFAGDDEPRLMYAARLRIGGRRILARVLALGNEPLLGRDVLNSLVLRVDGPKLQLQIVASRRAPPPPRKR